MRISLTRDVTIPPMSAVVLPYASAYAPQDETVIMTSGNDKLLQDGILVAHSVHGVPQGSKMLNMVMQVTNTT